jgi:hypothetical protein
MKILNKNLWDRPHPIASFNRFRNQFRIPVHFNFIERHDLASEQRFGALAVGADRRCVNINFYHHQTPFIRLRLDLESF